VCKGGSVQKYALFMKPIGNPLFFRGVDLRAKNRDLEANIIFMLLHATIKGCLFLHLFRPLRACNLIFLVYKKKNKTKKRNVFR